MRDQDGPAPDPFEAMRGLAEDFGKAVASWHEEVALGGSEDALAEAEKRFEAASDALARMLLNTPETRPTEPGDFSRGIVVGGVCYFATTDQRDRVIVHRVRVAWTGG